MVFYITKDWGSVTAIASNSGVPTEMDSTNAKGWYKIAVSQTESTADAITFTGKSSTANVSVVGQLIQTVPPNFGITSIDGSGNVAANATQFAGQTITAAAGVTIPSSIASPTNITAGTITTVTNLTNAPTAGDFTAAMKTSLNAATPASVTGAVGSVTGNVGGNVTGSVGSVVGAVGSVTGNVGGNVTGSVGSVVGLTAANLDVAVSTRLAAASYTTPPTTAAITTAVLTTQMTESYPALHTAPDAGAISL